MKHLILIIIFFASFSANAITDCKNATTTVEMNECAAEDQQRVEAKLNEFYKRVLKSIENDEVKKSLIIAQRAWITFRKADCDTLYKRYADGSIRTVTFLNCMQAHAEQRIKELDNHLVP